MGEMISISHLKENDKPFVAPLDMLKELMSDNKAMAAAMRETHELCDEHKDVATASLLEEYIDATELRTWFLFETIQGADQSGH